MKPIENNKIAIFAYILKPMKNLSKRVKLILLLVAVNFVGYGVAVAYFSGKAEANQDSFILSGLKSDDYSSPKTSAKLLDYCIDVLRLLKQG